ncbi:MAG: hypothetical protein MUF00_11040 [Gemmatimonadaceae bacterium]|nr:hypothetical protein [Gemmatimonadaceae bacterium]
MTHRRGSIEQQVGQHPTATGLVARWSSEQSSNGLRAAMSTGATVALALLPSRPLPRLSSARTLVGRVIRRAPFDAQCVRRSLSA